MNDNSKQPLFYSYSVLVNKCSGSYNDINSPYANVVKNMSIKVFNRLPKINETRYVSWHETCARKCRIVVNAGVNVKN